MANQLSLPAKIFFAAVSEYAWYYNGTLSKPFFDAALGRTRFYVGAFLIFVSWMVIDLLLERVSGASFSVKPRPISEWRPIAIRLVQADYSQIDWNKYLFVANVLKSVPAGVLWVKQKYSDDSLLCFVEIRTSEKIEVVSALETAEMHLYLTDTHSLQACAHHYLDIKQEQVFTSTGSAAKSVAATI